MIKTLFDLKELTTPNEWDSLQAVFQTPPAVAAYMISLIQPGTKTVLEPTPGQGNIVSLLKDYEVTAPDDFFLLQFQRFDCVVMNPPFSAKYASMGNAPANWTENGMKLGYYMLAECMRMSDHVIALMPWFLLLDSDVRAKALYRWGMASITSLPRKTFQYARIQTCILDLQKGYKGATVFKMF